MKKVLRRERCWMKMIPVIRPGRVSTGKARVFEMLGLSERGHSKDKENSTALLNSVLRQARKMRMNLKERKPSRSPLYGRIRQTPILSDFAIPRPAEMAEVRKVITNKLFTISLLVSPRW